jgi:hypothetical protein
MKKINISREYGGDIKDFYYPDYLKCINKKSTSNVQLNPR